MGSINRDLFKTMFTNLTDCNPNPISFLEAAMRVELYIWRLLEMLKFTKKIAISISLLALSSCHLYASSNNINNNYDDAVVERSTSVTRADQPNSGGTTMDKAIVSAVPQNPELYKFDALVFLKILPHLSKKINPATLRLVCRQWRGLLDAGKNPAVQNIFNQQGPLMQICMNNWWAERFKNGVLRHTSPYNKEGINLSFSSLGSVFSGTFELSACGDRSQYVVITTDVERFFQIRGANEGKVVILVAPRSVIEQQLSAAAQPFVSIMDGWDVAKAPVGIFWRFGDDDDLTSFDHLTKLSLAVISSQNLSKNWEKSYAFQKWREPSLWRPVSWICDEKAGDLVRSFSCFFSEPNSSA